MLHFPGGLRDSLEADIDGAVARRPAMGGRGRPARRRRRAEAGRMEWAVAWLEDGEGFLHSYCNTVPDRRRAAPTRPASAPPC